MRIVRFITDNSSTGFGNLEIKDKFNSSFIKLEDRDALYKTDSIITIGTFDGLHLGHKKILDTLISKGNLLNLRKVVVTFEPHPRLVLKNKSKKEIKLLTTSEEKLNYFQESGIDVVFIINFTEEFSKTSAVDFFKNYLIDKIGLKFLVIGYDHTFGKNREGNIETVKLLSKQYKFDFLRVDELRINNEIVSSTVIRNLINNKELEKASIFLGRNYSIIGKVISGDKRGQKLGFPTANIEIFDENKLIPPDGVYAVKVFINNQELLGMMNIGYRPTINKSIPTLSESKKFLEVHILDFDKDIYDEIIKVEFIKFIRDEKKFETIDKLVEQLKLDKKTVELLKQ
ncbi:MAG: bifunctional riboflavin kinase/FAD synthetase [Ignavibacteria bacterium]|nr:bifunctional riboflavin kinase/FAD synthetase [Ignavibacteria bacterium]